MLRETLDETTMLFKQVVNEQTARVHARESGTVVEVLVAEVPISVSSTSMTSAMMIIEPSSLRTV